MQSLGDAQPLTLAIAAFAGVVAVATVVVACCAYGIWKEMQKIETRASEFFDEWQPIAGEAKQAVQDFAEQSGELLSRLNSLTANLQKQSMQVEALIARLAASAQRNADSVDTTVQATLDRFNAATETLDRALRVPTTQLRALSAGLAAAMRNLGSRRQRDPARISADEEMFL